MALVAGDPDKLKFIVAVGVLAFDVNTDVVSENVIVLSELAAIVNNVPEKFPA